jgi:molybdate transport system permease protein
MMQGRGFQLVTFGAIFFALSIVISILWVQIDYAGLGALRSLFSDGSIRHAVFLSIGTATTAATLALIVAVPAAYGLARYKFPGSSVIDVLLDLPVVLSPVALGVCLLLLFQTAPGRWMESHLIRFVFEVPGIILAQFTVALALSIRILKASFQEIDVRYEQVARFLGCTPMKAFIKVTLPLARQEVIAAYILAWARAVGEFGATVMLAGAVQGETETIPIAIYMRLASVDVKGAVALIMLLSGLSLSVLVGVRIIGAKR